MSKRTRAIRAFIVSRTAIYRASFRAALGPPHLRRQRESDRRGRAGRDHIDLAQVARVGIGLPAVADTLTKDAGGRERAWRVQPVEHAIRADTRHDELDRRAG